MRLLRSGIRKLLRRPASIITLGLLVGLEVLLFLAVGASVRQQPSEEGAAAARALLGFPEAYRSVLSLIVGIGGFLVLIYGGAIAGSEWSWGTLKLAVARGEGRARYIVVTFGSLLVVMAVGLVLAYLAGLPAALLGAVTAGVPTDGISDTSVFGELPEAFARAFLSLAAQAALGYAVATIAKSQLAGIGVGIGVYFAEQFATIFAADIVKYGPFHAAQAILASGAGTGGGPPPAIVDPQTALVLVLLYLAGSVAVAAGVTSRAEISG